MKLINIHYGSNSKIVKKNLFSSPIQEYNTYTTVIFTEQLIFSRDLVSFSLAKVDQFFYK